MTEVVIVHLAHFCVACCKPGWFYSSPGSCACHFHQRNNGSNSTEWRDYRLCEGKHQLTYIILYA